ncbi:hypothetical protein NLG97_g4569 [Lecanicillium saksenae]|uniref:Uncharacterized protein n=1 Tax=Lecanicillium saksenae TaxID=468837 RepID=A0ACC1QYT9_9HYPO|nr:hypothetical protein NLG97_g4569 [Lecanicillium saksenae]
MSSTTRATRSRYSSPAHQTVAAPLGVNSPLEISKSSGNDASRSFMQRWLEPSVQSKASFEEAGLVRYGVLEGMAPLGALPKAKKPENGSVGAGASSSGVRKVILKTSTAARDGNAASSGAESSGDKSTTAVAASGNAVAGRKRAASPGARSTPVTSRRRRKKPARRSNAAVTVTKTQENRDLEGEQAAPALSPDKAGLKHYPTDWALRTLYDEKSEDPEFDSMVTDVLQQTADDDTLDGFSKHIGERKRQGRRDNGSFNYFPPPSPATTNRSYQAQQDRKPADSQYGDLVGDSEDEEELEEPEDLQSPPAEAGSMSAFQ